MKNLLIGFVLGYLICTFVLQGQTGVETMLTQSFATLQGWFDHIILYIQQYTPKA
jgi:hypothetical protein